MNSEKNKPEFHPFTYRTLDDLQEEINKYDLKIPLNRRIDILKTSYEFGETSFPNRLAIQPMEGFDATENGSPTDLTKRRYLRYADGGVGLIWFEATAINEACRSNPHQLMLDKANLSDFKKLVEIVRGACNKKLKGLGFDQECKLILQLNHSGRYTKKKGEKFPIRACRNESLDGAMHVSSDQGKIILDEELQEVEDLWVNKAQLAKKAGFDGVDIKACHGYLIGELLGARERDDSQYGGSDLEDRSKLLLNIIKKLSEINKEGSEFLITTRLGIYDGIPFPYGFGVKASEDFTYPATYDLTEPVKLIHMLHNYGVQLINISTGNPHYKPFITRPYDTPVKEGEKPPEHPLFTLNRNYQLTSLVKQKVPSEICILGSSYSYFRQFAGYVVSGLIERNEADICGFGRMAFANPSFAEQIFTEGQIDKNKTCITCSKCSQFMIEGKKTGCAIRDPRYKK
ncbi:MAG: flavin oxidoreductase/NADH oxidase [Promethearchaeia archaeon]